MLPVPVNIPPQEPEYHFQTAPIPNVPPEEFRVLGEPEQITDGVAFAYVAAFEKVFTEMVLLIQFVELHAPSALVK